MLDPAYIKFLAIDKEIKYGNSQLIKHLKYTIAHAIPATNFILWACIDFCKLSFNKL